MNNILIISQPTGNRGDESAHKALVRSLAKRDDIEVTVVFFGEPIARIGTMKVESSHIHYILIPQKRGKITLPKTALLKHVPSVLGLLPSYRRMMSYIKHTDYVICAPGGICMGEFMNWDHIYWLERTLAYKKPLAYYSRSFGPFPANSQVSSFFKDLSIKILNSFSFLSIRDSKTMKLADSLKLKYVPSIDTAFLETPNSEIPKELAGIDQYIVFVPNELTWHPAFFKASQNCIDEFFINTYWLITEKYPNHHVVMMPQLFGQGSRNDYLYFKKLSHRINSSKLIVLNDEMSSDIQQGVIANSKFVVGARYHSIVFAINNAIPFLSLSYEHKMFGLLEQLNLSDRQVDITKVGSSMFDANTLLTRMRNIINEEVFNMKEKQNEAKIIATSCFYSLCNSFLK